MASSSDHVRRLRESWARAAELVATNDYTLVEPLGGGYAAVTREHLPALVVPLRAVERVAVGRRAAGCELVPIRNATFRYLDREWEGAGAALVCHDADALEAFVVLSADVIDRIGGEPSWASVLEVVQEWQTLLASKGRPNAEGEIGLWGELWFIAAASHIPPLLAGWRGPDHDATDFFLDGIAAEVKTSRHRGRHHISLTQVPAPVGAFPSWILSIWVKEDPIRGLTVAELVSRIADRCEDRADLVRRLMNAGYVHTSATMYTTRYAVLDAPEWYASKYVPTIRVVDPGVSAVRYQVDLDGEHVAERDVASGLWVHFWGKDYDRVAL